MDYLRQDFLFINEVQSINIIHLCFLPDTQANPRTLYGILDQSVELWCGQLNSTVIFLWTFIALGTNLTVPIAWKDYIYEDAKQLGIVSLHDSTLIIDKVTLNAEGQFMCVVQNIKLPPVYIDLIVLGKMNSNKFFACVSCFVFKKL